jgi:maltooligosyltrehalose synthase
LRDVDPDWSGTMASLPEGRWTDWLTGRSFEGGSVAMTGLFATLPAVVFRPV